MLKFNITGDKIQLTSPRSFNSGSKGYYTAEFTFDSDWDGLIPHIVVIENGTQRADEVIIDNIHKIATTESGVMQISVYGLDAEGNKCISCNYVCIEVKQGAYTGVVPLPKDIWEGYQVTVLGYMERAEGAAIDARAAAEAAKKAENNIKNLSATATEGEAVSVKQTMTDDGIRLDFTLPRGKQGDIGPKGDNPVKGEDYFTPEDIESLNSELRFVPVEENTANAHVVGELSVECDIVSNSDIKTLYGNMYVGDKRVATEEYVDNAKSDLEEDIAGCVKDAHGELIEEITITEEGVREVIRTAEPDGTPYNFKSVSVWVEKTPWKVANVVVSHIYDDVNAYDYNDMAQYRASLTASETAGKYSHAYFDVYAGHWVCLGNYGTPQGVPMPAQMWRGARIYSGERIKRVRVHGYTTSLEVGTIIRIYGVRA